MLISDKTETPLLEAVECPGKTRCPDDADFEALILL
jgi:hypothetical protein